jgi:hypothetical protein
VVQVLTLVDIPLLEVALAVLVVAVETTETLAVQAALAQLDKDLQVLQVFLESLVHKELVAEAEALEVLEWQVLAAV